MQGGIGMFMLNYLAVLVRYFLVSGFGLMGGMFMLPLFLRTRVVTAPEYLERRFGPAARTAGSVLFQLQVLFRTGISDSHCGMRSFTREAYDRMHLRTTGMEFASEMVIKATIMERA